jgi:hypothetical protein
VLVFVLYQFTCGCNAATAEPSLIALVNVSTPLAALLKPTSLNHRYYSCSFSAAAVQGPL